MSTLAAADAEHLQHLEESLWRAQTRYDRDYMESILHPDFFEFGRSGRRYTREQCLAANGEHIRAELPLRNFTACRVGPEVALVTYTSVVTSETVEVGNRSSLWIRDGARWLLRFHQGTAVPRPDGSLGR